MCYYRVGMWNPMPGSRIDTQTTPGTTRSEMLTPYTWSKNPYSYRMLPLGGKDCISQSFKTPSLRSGNISVDARLQLVKDHDAFRSQAAAPRLRLAIAFTSHWLFKLQKINWELPDWPCHAHLECVQKLLVRLTLELQCDERNATQSLWTLTAKRHENGTPTATPKKTRPNCKLLLQKMNLFMQDLSMNFWNIASFRCRYTLYLSRESFAAMANALDRNIETNGKRKSSSKKNGNASSIPKMTVAHIPSYSSDFLRSKVSKAFTAAEFLRLFDLS